MKILEMAHLVLQAEWVSELLTNAVSVGGLTPFHLWLQTLLCLPHLCPELRDCPFILFYPSTPQCLLFFSSCCFLLESCFHLAQLHIDISPCLSSYCVCLGTLFWFRPLFFFLCFCVLVFWWFFICFDLFFLKICWFVVCFSFSQRPPTIISVCRFIQIYSKAKFFVLVFVVLCFFFFCRTEED